MNKYGYMCKTDFDYELGEALGGVEIYSSIKDIKKSRPCVENCGIIKVEIKIIEIAEVGTGWNS